MNKKITEIKTLLQQSSHIPKEKRAAFYKTGPGQYAQHDKFIGVSVPILRKIAKKFQDMSLAKIQMLIASPINEERLFALFILIYQYQKADDQTKNTLYQFYMDNIKNINNWNLVDASAHLIIGAHLFKTDKVPLIALAKSKIMWERRIAIVATWYFIRNDTLKWTFSIAEILLNDNHDLIHKAVGWMLREAGKRNKGQLVEFLNKHSSQMPRTMLRYAIEKFLKDQRKLYLLQ